MNFSWNMSQKGSAAHEEIQRFNKEFNDILFNMLEESRDGDIFLHQVIPDVFARLSDPQGYPGDNWREIVESDKRLMSDGTILKYPKIFRRSST